MATREIAEWSTTDASNNFTAAEGGWAEGMLRSDVNNAARADMGAIRRWYDAPEWLDVTVGASITRASATTITIAADYSSYFTDGRRVKLTGGATDPWYATCDGDSTYSAPTLTITLKDFSSGTAIPTAPDPTAIYVNILQNYVFSTSALYENDTFIKVTTLTGTALQAAIATAEDNGGGIIVLEPGATYVVDSTILVGYGASPGGTLGQGNVRIIGRGAILQAGTSLDTEIMRIEDDALAAINANVILDDLTFDGNSAAQTGGTGLGMLAIGTKVAYVRLHRVFFSDAYGHGLTIETGSENLWISDCVWNTAGENGIEITDGSSNLLATYIDRCRFYNFGQTVDPSAGIHAAGQVTISNCTFQHMNHATYQQRGIWLAQKQAAPLSDQSAHQCNITNCYFHGTGLNTRGIFHEGRDCTITGCSFYLTGAGTEGIYMDQTSVGRYCERNTIADCTFYGMDRAIQLTVDAQDTVVSGCTIDNATYGYTDAGTRNTFQGSKITNVTDGVTLQATAAASLIQGNLIDSPSSEGVTIAAGANYAKVIDNTVNSATTADITDGGNYTAYRSAENAYFMEVFSDDLTAISVTTTETLVSAFTMTLGAYADGVKQWILDASTVQGNWGANAAAAPIYLRVRYGQNSGTPTSDTILTTVTIYDHYNAANVADGDYWCLQFPRVTFTPAAGDDVYVTVEASTGTQDIDIKGTSSTRDTFIRVRPV